MDADRKPTRAGLALGLMPHFPDAARLPAEDALALRRERTKRSRGGRPTVGGPASAPHRQFRRSRSAAARARRRSDDGRGRASPCRLADLDHPAGLEGHDRRSRRSARGRLGHRPRWPMRGAAAACSASAAAIRCWAAPSPTPTASRARPAVARASACSMSDTVLGGDKTLRPVAGTSARDDVAVHGLRDAHRRHHRPRLRAPAAPVRRRRDGRCALARRPHRRLLCAWPVHATTASARPGCGTSALRPRRSTMRPHRERRSTPWPTIWSAMSISTAAQIAR